MKYTVLGFSQQRLMELGLGMDEAMILRWFIDYQATGKMRKMTIDGICWVWVNYAGVLGDIPIVGGSAKTISRRFEKLQASGVMEHTTLREGGTFSCYRINEAVYATLIDDAWAQVEPVDDDPVFDPEYGGDGRTELSEGGTLLGEGVGQICTRGSDKSVRPKDSSTRKTLLLDKKQEGSAEKQKSGDLQIPDSITNSKLREAVQEFMAYRSKTRSPLTQVGLDKLVKKLERDWSDDDSRIRDIQEAIIRGYRGVFPNKDFKTTNKAATSEQQFRSGRFNDAWEGKTTREVEL